MVLPRSVKLEQAASDIIAATPPSVLGISTDCDLLLIPAGAPAFNSAFAPVNQR